MISERIVNDELTRLLEAEEIIPESQAGFRRKRSTHDQLFKMTQSISDGFRRDEVTMAALYDIEKSFDKIWHRGLLLKLKTVLPETDTAFIQSYLKNRQIRIKINDAYSEPITLRAGTPQGSILSPQLHNLWCHDLPQPSGSNDDLSQFADDLAIWTRHKSVKQAQRALQLYNDRIARWCKVWRVRLNVRKTQVILFHKKRVKKRPSLIVEGASITATKTCEFLGVTLDKRLTIKHQVKKIEKEVSKRTKLFRKIAGTHIKPRADSELSQTIFRSMILPLTTYAPSVLCLAQKSHLEKIDVILRKGMRLAIHAPPSTTNDYISDETGLTSTSEAVKRLAKKYILDDKRSKSVKAVINRYERSTGTEPLTPLDVILQQK